jgi:hypothetical protein
MGEEAVPFGGQIYLILFAFLVFARGMDFLSTWIATPTLLLEANPIAKKMGWRVGLIFNALICVVFGMWPLPSVVIITTSLLVAARNLQSAWLMRSFGEHQYRFWMGERLAEAPKPLFFFCLCGQSAFYALIGATLLYFSHYHLVPFGIGMGMITYAVAVLVYSSLSVWRLKPRRV